MEENDDQDVTEIAHMYRNCEVAREIGGTGTRDFYTIFFFQAEDGIRDVAVTGVQTCALPISIDELRDAIRIDTGFALAYYRMSHAAELLGRDAETRMAAEAAVRVADRLDDHYRRVLSAAVARRSGNIEAAEDAYTRLTFDYPNDADAWFGLGEALFHLNPLRGRSAIGARGAFIKVVELDPRHVEALTHLARIDALAGDTSGANGWLQLAREHATNDDLLARLALHVRTLGGAPSVGGVDRQRLQRASTLQRGPGPRELLTTSGVESVERYAAQFL